jgi:predicted PurR-regulated permease PerM
MDDQSPKPISPAWGNTTKTIVGLTVAGLLVAFLFYLRALIGPLLLSVVLTYLLHPVVVLLSRKTHLSWRGSVNIIFILLLLLILGSSTAAWLAIVQQAQSLIRTLERVLSDLPAILDSLASQRFVFGPFEFNPGIYLDANTLANQLINIAQPLVGRAGTLVTTLATGAANTATWFFFILIVSYFTLADTGEFPDAASFINLPGYDEDIRRLARDLGRIWNAFLRGQVTIILLAILVYTIIWAVLGVRFSLALAIVAGLARFVPYLGNALTWILLLTVTFFQSTNNFGLTPVGFTILVAIPTFIIDQIFDVIVSPRILGQSLHINPGAVLVVAIIAANFIGIIGIILAAPVLATFQLFGRYILRKLADQDPFPEPEPLADAGTSGAVKLLLGRIQTWWKTRRQRK